MAITKEADEAVQNYLTWVQNRESLINQARVDELTKKLEAVTDPIEKLKIFTELSVEQEAPEERYLQPFLKHAVEWAEENEIPVDGFQWMGVQRKHLITAGFEVKGRGGPRRRDTANTVTAQMIMDQLAKKNWTFFTKPMLMELTGALPSTTTTAVNTMIEKGIAVQTDKEDPNHKGRGAKAIVYDVA